MTRVLIVEGEDTLRDCYALALGEDGFEILTAASYTDALAKNLLHRPEVIVMDPGADPRWLDFVLEFARVNSRVRVVLNTLDPYQYHRDFSCWVVDGMAEKSGDAMVLVHALHRLVGKRTPA